MKPWSKVGFGTIPIMLDRGEDLLPPRRNLTTSQAIDVLNYAYEKGITVFDTSRDYGDSEEKIAAWIEQHNPEGITLISKAKGYTKETMDSLFKQSISILPQITHYMIHYLQPQHMTHIMDVIAYLKHQRGEGIIKGIGVGTHDYVCAKAMIETNELDIIELPVNIYEYGLYNRLKDLIKEYGVTLIPMKIYGGGAFLQTHKPAQLIGAVRTLCDPQTMLIGIGTKEEIDIALNGYASGQSHRIIEEECDRCQRCDEWCEKKQHFSRFVRYTRYLVYSDYYKDWAYRHRKPLDCKSCRKCFSCEKLNFIREKILNGCDFD